MGKNVVPAGSTLLENGKEIRNWRRNEYCAKSFEYIFNFI
jgi:hypothetical protein